MGSSLGHLFRVTTFGESHGPAVGAIVDGCPPRLPLDRALIQADLDRRRPGRGRLASPRGEADQVEILSGVREGLSLGTPIALLIRNTDHRPADYEALEDVYRPGHADHTTEAKYGIRDHRGGGRASARETAARVAAGAVARRLLLETGTEVVAWVDQVGGAIAGEIDSSRISREAVDRSPVRCPDERASLAMAREIESAGEAGDSVGGAVRCLARGLPAGWGEPVFDKLGADLARALMSIPAAQGFEVGAGMAAAGMRGSEHTGALSLDGEVLRSRPGHGGGLAGGISTGEDLLVRVAFKPPSSIGRPRPTVTRSGATTEISLSGRHDPCVAPRAAPIVEAMVLLVLADHLLRHRALVGETGAVGGPRAHTRTKS